VTSPTGSGGIGAATVRVRIRRAFTEDWLRINPILREGEPGYDRSKNMLKIGDGVTAWADLPYLSSPDVPSFVIVGNAAVDAAIKTHVESNNPHPVYDDGPSLLLLYQNAKV
jgi:hypothetical protein